jgi:hypothetical protein
MAALGARGTLRNNSGEVLQCCQVASAITPCLVRVRTGPPRHPNWWRLDIAELGAPHVCADATARPVRRFAAAKHAKSCQVSEGKRPNRLSQKSLPHIGGHRCQLSVQKASFVPLSSVNRR